MIVGPLDAADQAELTASTPDLAVHHWRRLAHPTIVPPPDGAEHHDDFDRRSCAGGQWAPREGWDRSAGGERIRAADLRRVAGRVQSQRQHRHAIDTTVLGNRPLME